MTADRNYRGVRSQITWGEEHPVEQSLSGGTVTTNTVTGLTGMTVDKYAGQMATPIPRNATPSGVDGMKLHIVTNSATVITFEEDVATLGLTNSYTLVITQRNVTPAAMDHYFGHVEESELPERKLETFKGFYKGSSNQPYATEIVPMKAVYEASIPLRVVTGQLLALAMGYVSDDGANAGTFTGTSTVLYPIVPGQRTFTTTAAHSFVSGDYVQVNLAADAVKPEIRRCTTGTTGSTIVVSEPFRREHPAAAPLRLVAITSGYISHTLQVDPVVPYWSLKRTLYNYDTNSVLNDYVKVYRGLKAKSIEMSITPGDAPLQASISVAGLSIDDTSTYTREATVDMSGYSNKTPYIHKGAVTKINDITYRQSGEFNGNIDREMETKYYSELKPQTNDQTYGYLDPSEHIEGLVNSGFKFNIPLHNKNFWTLLKTMAKIPTESPDNKYCSHAFNRGTNDTLTIYFGEPVLVEGSEALPKGGEIPLDLNFESTYMKIVIVDSVYYY